MHDAGQCRQFGPHGGQDVGDVVRVGNIGRDDPDFGVGLFAYRIDALLRGVAGCASASQHQVPGSVRGQICGDFQPDRAQPTGHEISCVVTQRERCRGGLPRTSRQPRNVNRLVPKRELVFTGRRCHQLVDQPRPHPVV